MWKILKNNEFWIYMGAIILLATINACVSVEDDIVETPEELSINYHSHQRLLENAIDSAQNVIRDSIRKVNNKIQYWDSFDTGLPSGSIVSMARYNGTEYSLDGKTSTSSDYGIITVRKGDGELVTSIVSHDQYIVLNPNDIIR